MENNGISLSDIAALMKNGDGNWETVLIILFLLICMGGNWGNRQQPQGNSVLDSTLAAAGAQGGFVTQSDLDSTVRMQGLQQGQRDITAAVTASEQRLTANQTQALQNQAAFGQQLQTCCSEIKANCDGNYQKIMDKLNQDKIDSLQQQVNQLQLAHQMSNVVRYPTATTYSSGSNPFCGCNCAAV